MVYQEHCFSSYIQEGTQGESTHEFNAWDAKNILDQIQCKMDTPVYGAMYAAIYDNISFLQALTVGLCLYQGYPSFISHNLERYKFFVSCDPHPSFTLYIYVPTAKMSTHLLFSGTTRFTIFPQCFFSK